MSAGRTRAARLAGVWLALLGGMAPARGAAGAAHAAPSYTLKVYDQRLMRGIDLIYNLEFEKANRYFQAIIAAEPENPVGYFFLAMVGWWRVLLDLESREHDKALDRLLEQCIKVSDRRLKKDKYDFDAIICKGGAIGFRGRLRGDRGKIFAAARDGMRAIPLLKLSRELDPTNKDILFGQGIYNYFAEVMPKRHKILRVFRWLLRLPRGDREKGLEQLRQVAAEGYYARTEATYFLAQVYRLFEGDKARSVQYLETLHARYPQNSVFHRFLARDLVDLGRWERAIPLHREIARRCREGRTGYHLRAHVESLYSIGRYEFRRQRPAAAAAAFVLADSLGRDLEGKRDRAYAAMSNLYLGMSYDLEGKREKALRQYRRVKKLSRYKDSHKRAAQYLKEPYHP